MLIRRYIIKEVFQTFCAIVCILLFIALSNKFVIFLSKAASGKIPLSLVFKIIALYLPELFAMMAPVAMFIAILFTYSRLHADSEVAVLLTTGFDWQSLVNITLRLAAAVAILVAGINLLLVPISSTEREKLIAEGQIAGVINAITPGRFQTIENNDQLVFYVENILPDGKLHNIFIAQADKPPIILTAKTAYVKQQNDQNEFYLILHDGYRYTGIPGTANYSITAFAEYGRQLKYAAGPMVTNEYGRPSLALWHSADPADIAELQWRLAMPIAVLILALIAIPLSKVQPRQGRYAKFLPAVLLYMLYYNLLTITRRSIANGTSHDFVGFWPNLWTIHALFVLIAIVLLLHVSGRLAEMKYKLLNT